MGAAESSQCVNYDIFQKDGSYNSPFGWELHNAKSKVDSSIVSIFKTSTKSLCSTNALKKIRIFKHPSILRFVEGNESETGVFYATELAIPLSKWLEYAKGKSKKSDTDPLSAYLPKELENDQLVSWCMWGLAGILKALKFVNEDAKQVHGLIHPSSIFVTQSGAWKLGSFDLCYEFHAKEQPPSHYIDKQQMLPTDYRSPERSKNNYTLISDCVSWSQDMYSFGQLLEFVFSGLQVPEQLSNNSLKCKSAPLGRPAPSRLLSIFSKHPLVKSLTFLEEKAIKDPIQKETFFNQLNTNLTKFPAAITVEYILPLLMDELVHGQTEFSPIVLPSVIIIGGSLPSERFAKEISPLITQLFSRKDRATRLQLLKNLDSYITHIDKRVINSDVFPQVIIGFGDTSANMREATIRTMIPLAPFLDTVSQNKMVRALSGLQDDPLPAIRTNVLVCLNKVMTDLDPDVRRQLAFPCIGRGLKDPFCKARIQSLKTIKGTQHYFDDGLLARRILPSLCPLLWDVEVSVRDSAFEVIQSLLSRLYAGHQEWNKTGVEPKAPVDSPKQLSGVMGVTGSYVSTAMSWVTGSLRGKDANVTTTSTVGAVGDKGSNQPPKSISSKDVSRVMPATIEMNVSIEDLEAMGRPSVKKEELKREEPQRDDDIWGESSAASAVGTGAGIGEVGGDTGWGTGWAVDEEVEEREGEKEKMKDPLKSIGGWDDGDLGFSDDDEKEKEKKENATLAMIRQMATKDDNVSSKNTVTMTRKDGKHTVSAASSAPLDLDDWAQELAGDAKKETTRSSRRGVVKESMKTVEKKDEIDLSSILGETGSKKQERKTHSTYEGTSKTSKAVVNGWDEDEKDDLFGNDDTKSNRAVKSSAGGWGDDWDEKPSTVKASKPSKPVTGGWGDEDDLFGSDAKPTKLNVSAKPTKPVANGWDDDWDEKPSKAVVNKPTPKAATSGWNDDWDEKPVVTKPTSKVTASGWDDDWDEKPIKAVTKKKAASGWDNDW